MRYTEDICVFSYKAHNYYPITEKRDKPKDYSNCKTLRSKNENINHFHSDESKLNVLRTEKYPSNIISISSQIAECNNLNRIHPTQKPLALIEYLIKTYTIDGELILDNTFGSCTTGIACINTNRNFIGIENNMDYFNISLKRVEEKRKEKDFNVVTSFGDGM